MGKQYLRSLIDQCQRVTGNTPNQVRLSLSGPQMQNRGDLRISIKQEILTSQIRALYHHTPMILAVNVINSGLVALVLASYMRQTRWWIFFGLVVTLTVARAIGWRLYHGRRT